MGLADLLGIADLDCRKVESTKWLSGHLPEIQAGVEVVKIKNPDFSCWAGSTP